MTPTEALNRLCYGGSISCVTPEGKRFEIESKLSYGIPWYRTIPATAICGLQRYSRLSNQEMIDWLSRLTIEDQPCTN